MKKSFKVYGVEEIEAELKDTLIGDFWLWRCNCNNKLSISITEEQRDEIAEYYYWCNRELEALPYWDDPQYAEGFTNEQDKEIDEIIGKCADDIIHNVLNKKEA